MRVGFHVSIAGSIDLSVDRALEKEYTTFQIFTRNPRGWAYKPLNSLEVESFQVKMERSGINPVVAHMPYLPNLASPKDDIYGKSKETLRLELERCHLLKIPFLVTHLGSHLGRGRDYGMTRITDAVNEAFSLVKGDVMLLLENTAGTRNSMGSRFNHIAKILEGCEDQDRVGLCFDTCHAYAAGYDLKTFSAVSKTLEEFDKAIGVDRLKVVHINDSKGGLGSKIDRHEHIGLGRIGMDGFTAILSHPFLNRLPLILETPLDLRRDDIGNLNTVKCIASQIRIT